MRSHAGLSNVMACGLACHMLVCVCLLGSSLFVHAKPENLGCRETQLAFKIISYTLILRGDKIYWKD